MKKKVTLIIWLMAFCTIFLVGLQLYWNYQAFQNSRRVFKSDINNSLDKAVSRLMNKRRDEFTTRYKKWLSDTSLIEITCRYNDTVKSTIFYLKDRYPPYSDRAPFTMGLNDFTQHLNTITPLAKTFFIDHFIKNLLHQDLETGSAYFYTQRLGDSLVQLFNKDKLRLPELISLYKQELAERDIDNSFHLTISKYDRNGFYRDHEMNKDAFIYSTASFKYGFSSPLIAVKALFPNPNMVFLEKMKWILLSSLVLIGITIVCFTYTVKTLLTQKKLTELKNDFVNNMTHELKTPVATITIASEAIQDFGLSKASKDEYLSIIRYQAGNLTKLIDQILKSMLTEQAEIKFNLAPVSWNDIINNCFAQYKPQLRATDADLIVHIKDEPIWIIGDSIHLGNVMANMLDNAIKYSDEKPVIDVRLFEDKENAIFKITNNGIGIPKEYQNKIFDRFFRVPSGDIHNVKGYGLGLTYVKEIIKQHNGKITLTSSRSQTTFTIQIPVAKHEPSPDIVT